MQNTVVQELIDIMSKVDNDFFSKDQIILVLSNYLKAEKEQIITAFYEGDRQYSCMSDAVNYYEETYLK